MRSVSYGFIGGFLSIGAPLGLLALRLARQRSLSWSPGPLANELRSDLDAYAYVGISTAVAFTVFGIILGRRADALAELSETDELTGLHNARGFSRRLNEEVARFARYREPIALLLLDVDGLKRINDTLGHAAGNLALRHVATAIRAELRASDVGARWGGDEFAILAPNTSNRAALALAERVGCQIASPQVPWRSTVSIGVATTETAQVQQRLTAASMMHTADVALYEAKTRGRGSIVVRDSTESPPVRQWAG
jgi:diguanylate cyclase (GGDEF)-like protein